MNTSKIREKLKALQKSGKGKSKELWKPAEGKTVVRLVPYKKQPEYPFIEMHMHYQFGKKTYCSPVTIGEPDPIMEFAEELQSDGSRENWIQGKKLEPKLRVFVPVIIRGKEKEGVKMWGFGKRVYEELLTLIDDPDYGDISDPKTGRDLTVEYKTAAQTGKTYGEIYLRAKPNQSPLLAEKDMEFLNKIVNEQPDLMEIYEVASYDTLEKALYTYLNPDEDEPNQEEVSESNTNIKTAPASEDVPAENDTTSSTTTSTKEDEPKKAKATKEESTNDPVNVASAFDNLFNEDK